MGCWLGVLVNNLALSLCIPYSSLPPNQSTSEVKITPSNEAPSSYSSILELKPLYIDDSSSNLTLTNLFSVLFGRYRLQEWRG